MANDSLQLNLGSLRSAMRYAVWALYYAAQVLITLGILLGGA